MSEKIELWRWSYIATEGPRAGKRVESSWLMTEKEAAKYKDAKKIEGTLDTRTGNDWSMSRFQSSPRTSAKPDGTR